MQERDKKSVFIQTSVYADAMIAEMCAMPVIPQNTFAMLGNGKMNFI